MARRRIAGRRWPADSVLDFRGRTVALTFFFTRCPLPEFCPRMNSNFAAARALLQSAPGARTNYCFLSISFDSDFDRPAQLTAYAHAFRQGGGVPWVFAAAPPETLGRLPRRMGLSYRGQGGGISHNLRTVVLDPQGQVFRQFDATIGVQRNSRTQWRKPMANGLATHPYEDDKLDRLLLLTQWTGGSAFTQRGSAGAAHPGQPGRYGG